MRASWLINRQEYAKALDAFESLYSHKDEIIPLYVKEIACEMVFLHLAMQQPEKASTLLDKSLKDYISAYRKVMSSKERILCAIALYIDNDKAKAIEIYEKLLKRRSEFLLQGEINSDLALMEDMLTLSYH
ncbi:putative uncharacterized protein [Bacteroides sp. CAG:927]|nr:putative uncharacterized protein [Bacteroides sp. CAG:927]